MHCDDNRTKFALRQYILDATTELGELTNKIKTEPEHAKKLEIQNRINYLRETIKDSEDQISSMNQA